MNKGAHEHLKWSLFGMTWDFLQLLACECAEVKASSKNGTSVEDSICSNSADALYRVFPWEDVPQMHWLLTLLLYVNPTNATLKVEPLAAVVLLFTSLLWIFTTIVAAVWSAYCFSIGDFSTVLPLKFLRATGGLTVVLFVPVVGLLVRVTTPLVTHQSLVHATITFFRSLFLSAPRALGRGRRGHAGAGSTFLSSLSFAHCSHFSGSFASRSRLCSLTEIINPQTSRLGLMGALASQW